jgi:hypothetical protein
MKTAWLLFVAFIITNTLPGEIYQGSPGNEEPAYLNIKEVEVKQAGSRTLRFTVKFNAEVARKSEQQENVWLCLDADHSAKTGQVDSYDKSFGYDSSVYLTRPARDTKFNSLKPNTYGNLFRTNNYNLEIKNIRLSQDTLSFEASSKSFFDYKQLKFNLCTTIGTMDDKHDNEVAQYKTVSWLSKRKALEFKLEQTPAQPNP